MAKNLSPEDKKLLKILEAYQNGGSAEKLAKRMGCHISTFYRRMERAEKLAPKAKAPVKRTVRLGHVDGHEIIKQLGVTKKTGSDPRTNRLLVTDEEILRVSVEEGLSTKALAERYGVTPKTIRARLQKAQEAGHTAKPTLVEAVQRVMEDQVLDGKSVLKLLKLKGWAPASKNAQMYVQATLSQNKDLFEPVSREQGGGRGHYRCLKAVPSSVTTLVHNGSQMFRVDALAEKGESYQAMKDVWAVCTKAGLAPPAEVLEFFGHRPPAAEGRLVPLTNFKALRPKERAERVVVIPLDSIPKGAHSIRIEF